jgi:HEAT repeat protein
MALRTYQYLTSEQPFKITTSGGKIPIYVPMKNYSLYLKQVQADTLFSDAESDAEGRNATLSPSLLSYLVQSDLPGMRYLHTYIIPLFKQGRLLFLCDGLNEVDSDYLTQVSTELAAIMRTSQNRLVITCREVDYRDQADFVELVEDGRATRVVVYPLQLEQVYAFVERYVEQQSDQWRHTAGQIMVVIDRSRLRYHCTNPMMLFTLMGIIDNIGVDYGKLIDTRGLLLRESVSQLIAQEIAKWNGSAPVAQDVVRFLSEVACAARWAQDRNAIQLTTPARVGLMAQGGARSLEVIRDELAFWLTEHRAQGPFVVESESKHESYGDTVPLLRFAQSAGLIDISSDGVLSFRHELIAEYLVAEYFLACEPGDLTPLTIREELLEDVGRWSEPVAIWAGLLDDPLELAECFGRLGVHKQTYVLQALTLGLICVGVLWTPPQAEVPHYVELPPAIGEALSIAVQNKAAREELAQLFTHSAEEGGLEVYRSLLPLVTLDGIEELIVLLDHTVVPDLLFTQLQDAISNPAYEQQVKRIVRVLGLFGTVVIARATELSLPAPERSLRLRAAAVNTLGGTNDVSAVEPLMERLQDSEMFIAQRATNALIRLGPQLTLERVLEELDVRANGPFLARVHQAVLTVVDRFLDDKDATKYQVSLAQYQQILEHVAPMLTSRYQAEPETQQVAREFLVKQGKTPALVSLREKRAEKAIDALLGYLSSQDAAAVQHVLLALQEIGAPAVPRLIERLSDPSETVRVRVVDILVDQRDFRALDALLLLLSDSQPTVRQHAMRALEIYAPESIPGLIEIILTGPDDVVAERAATVLETIGSETIDPVIDALTSTISARTRFLVQVLESLRDPPALITLLSQPQLPVEEPLLAVSIIRALCLFSDAQVVQPLLNLLPVSNTLVYEQAIMALSQLGMVAFAELILALDQPTEPVVIQRVRRAVIMMAPFPGEQLIGVLEQHRSAAQAEQIVAILRDKGQDAAPILVANLLHRDESVREYVQQTLEQMPGAIVVPALLDALYQPDLQPVVAALLLRYPDAAMPPLVGLLGEHERSIIAVDLLPRFGAAVLRPLVAGLNDQRASARELAQHVIISLARQRQGQEQQQILLGTVHLFHPTLPPYAREALLDLLTETLADVKLLCAWHANPTYKMSCSIA